jgi:hypothetical protein
VADVYDWSASGILFVSFDPEGREIEGSSPENVGKPCGQPAGPCSRFCSIRVLKAACKSSYLLMRRSLGCPTAIFLDLERSFQRSN